MAELSTAELKREAAELSGSEKEKFLLYSDINYIRENLADEGIKGKGEAVYYLKNGDGAYMSAQQFADFAHARKTGYKIITKEQYLKRQKRDFESYQKDKARQRLEDQKDKLREKYGVSKDTPVIINDQAYKAVKSNPGSVISGNKIYKNREDAAAGTLQSTFINQITRANVKGTFENKARAQPVFMGLPVSAATTEKPIRDTMGNVIGIQSSGKKQSTVIAPISAKDFDSYNAQYTNEISNISKKDPYRSSQPSGAISAMDLDLGQKMLRTAGVLGRPGATVKGSTLLAGGSAVILQYTGNLVSMVQHPGQTLKAFVTPSAWLATGADLVSKVKNRDPRLMGDIATFYTLGKVTKPVTSRVSRILPKYRELEIKTIIGETKYKALGFEYKNKALIIGGKSRQGFFLGAPKGSKIGRSLLTQRVDPVTAIEGKLALSTLKLSSSEIQRIRSGTNIMKTTENTPSTFYGFSDSTKTLSEKGTKYVLDFAKKERAVVYGSLAAEAQIPLRSRRVIGDIDLQLQTASPELALSKVKTLAHGLKALGEPVRVNKLQPTLIEARGAPGGKAWRHAVDVHYYGMDLLSGEIALEGTYGLNFGQSVNKYKGVPTMRLSEQGLRKGASVLGIEDRGVYPRSHRLKDIPDFIRTQEVLANNLRFPLKRLNVLTELETYKGTYDPNFLSRLMKQSENTPFKFELYNPSSGKLSRSVPKSASFGGSLGLMRASPGIPSAAMSSKGISGALSTKILPGSGSLSQSMSKSLSNALKISPSMRLSPSPMQMSPSKRLSLSSSLGSSPGSAYRFASMPSIPGGSPSFISPSMSPGSPFSGSPSPSPGSPFSGIPSSPIPSPKLIDLSGVNPLSSTLRGAKRGFKYMPDISSFAFGLTRSRRSKSKLTGLEIRPLITKGTFRGIL